MMNQNETEILNAPLEIENKNKRSVDYSVPFPETLTRNFDKFIENFHTSYEILFNYLLNNHFNFLLYEIKEDDNTLLIFYYFCVDVIFSENNNSDYNSPNKSEMNIQNINVKITEEFDDVIKEICEAIHYKPDIFISKAIKCQWEQIQGDIEAGYYYIIDDFCNISKIKQALEKVVKQSKVNKELSKKEGLNKDENKSK